MAALGVWLAVAGPLAAAQTGNGDDQSLPSRDQEQEAQAACGGGPIEGGKDVQPTPERDKCLAEHLRSGKAADGDGSRRPEQAPASRSGGGQPEGQGLPY
jgi:hypothetical protein